MRSVYYLRFVLFSAICVSSCTSYETIQTRPFPKRNPTSGVFAISEQQLRDTLISLFSIQNQLNNKILNRTFYTVFKADTITSDFEVETNQNSLFGREYFTHPTTANDIFLHNFRQPWSSRYYYSGNHALNYVTDFAIKLRPLSNHATQVIITAYKPEVINGVAGYGPHGAVARYTPVQPTTIEEYTLLLFIAGEIGIYPLAPLQLPQ